MVPAKTMRHIHASTHCETCGGVLISGESCNACLLGMFLEEEPRDADESPNLDMEEYEFLERIGRGGMGVVYKVRHRRLNRLEALKRMSPTLQDDPKMVMRFLREAEAVGRLDHPSIVPVYGTGEDEDGPFFTMRLVEHGSLADRLKEGPIEPREAVTLMLGIAQAVEHAHQRGVLHRDLKPGNILLLGNGQAAVSDFGLARITEGRADITVEALNIGSPAYMAPEHLQGSGSISSDIYSLGAVLFEMLTGRPPFVATTAATLLKNIEQEEAPSLLKFLPKVDLDLATLCARCLEKSPERRYASAGLFADDLRAWLHGEPIKARPVRPAERLGKWMRRHPLLAGLSLALCAVIVAAGVGAAISVRSIWQARDGERLALAESEKARNAMAQQLYISSIRLAHATLEEGDPVEAQNQLALGAKADPNANLRGWEWYWLVTKLKGDLEPGPTTHPVTDNIAASMAADGTYAVATHEKLYLYGDDDVLIKEWPVPISTTMQRAMAFSPDSQRVALSADEGLFIYGRDGKLQTHAKSGPKNVVSFAPDNQSLVATDGTETTWFKLPEGTVIRSWPLALMSLAWENGVPLGLEQLSTEARLIRLLETPEAIYRAGPATRTVGIASPDGRTFVVGLSDRLDVVDIRTGKVLHTIPNDTLSFQLAFSRDGSRLLAGGASSLFTVVDTKTWKSVGKMRTPVSGAAACLPRGGNRWSLLLIDGSLYHCRTQEPSEFPVTDRFLPEPNLRHGAILTDQGKWCFWDTSPTSNWKSAKEFPGDPVGWSADGKTLFVMSKHKQIFTWMIGDDGLRPIITLSEPASGAWLSPSLSPDGKLLAAQTGENHVVVFSIETGQALHRTKSQTFRQCLFSPDSQRLLYYVIDPEGKNSRGEVPVILDLQTKAETAMSTQITSTAAWSPDSKSVAYGHVSNLILCDASTGEMVRVLGSIRTHLMCCAFTPDGKTILATGIDSQCSFFNVPNAAALFRLDLPAPARRLKFSLDGKRCMLTDPLPVTFLDTRLPQR